MTPEIGSTVLLKDGRVCVVRAFADTWRGPTWTGVDKSGKEISFGQWDYRTILSDGPRPTTPAHAAQPTQDEGQAAFF